MWKISKRERYDLHKTKTSVAYGTWTVRIRDWMDWFEALKKTERKPYIVDKSKLHYREYKKMERTKTDTTNIVSNRKEYLIIKGAYQNQINGYDTNDKDEQYKADELEKEMNNFIRENIKYERGDF